MGKIRHSFTQQKKMLMPEEDNCPICKESLALNDEYTQRVGLLDFKDDVTGWLCPHCKTEFDTDNNVDNFFGKGYIRGEA